MATLLTKPYGVTSMCSMALPVLASSTSTPTMPATQIVLVLASNAGISLRCAGTSVLCVYVQSLVAVSAGSAGAVNVGSA